MDAVNHLIPSDQLDDTLDTGQNPECEGRNELGAGDLLDDSLEIMLSDKDPMFGSASPQFNPLDGDDANFLIAADATGMYGGAIFENNMITMICLANRWTDVYNIVCGLPCLLSATMKVIP